MKFLLFCTLMCIALVKSEMITLDMSYEYVENETYFFFPHHFLVLEPDAGNGVNPETGSW